MSIAAGKPEADSPSIFCAEIEWRAGRYDRALIEIAEGRLAALWVAVDTGAVFAPYDGGVYLIYPSDWERDAAHALFSM
jgi:hypothetical protein